MMNALALGLVLTSLVTAGFFSPNPEKPKSKDDVIVKEGRRVVVVEYEKDEGNTKVSISPQDSELKDKLSEKIENMKEEGTKDIAAKSRDKMSEKIGDVKEASSKVEEINSRFKPRELVCDAYGKCKHKIASVIGKTTEEEAKAIGKVKDTVSDSAHKAFDKVEEAKEKVSEKASGIRDEASRGMEGAKEKVLEKASGVKEEASRKMEEAREKVLEKAIGVKEEASRKMEEAREKVSEKASGVKEEASRRTEGAKEKVLEKASGVKEEASRRMEGAKEKVSEIGEEASRRVEGAKEKVSEIGEEASRRVEGMKKEGEKELGEIMRHARDVVGEVFNYVFSVAPVTGVLHLMGFAAAYGMCVWVTFGSSHVLAGALPRQQFAMVQSRIYPLYFKAMGYSVGMALLGHLMSPRKILGTRFRGFDLTAALALVLLNLFYLEPRATKVMHERMKMEKEEGTRKEVHARAPDSTAETAGRGSTGVTERGKRDEVKAEMMVQLSRSLQRLNCCSSFVNVMTLVSLTWHLVGLGQRLHAVC